ncbi:hypothetical protein L9F63_020160, partial [Diploptera punctata]
KVSCCVGLDTPKHVLNNCSHTIDKIDVAEDSLEASLSGPLQCEKGATTFHAEFFSRCYDLCAIESIQNSTFNAGKCNVMRNSSVSELFLVKPYSRTTRTSFSIHQQHVRHLTLR